MFFLDKLLRYCSRGKIFLSYSSDQRALAEDIAQALTNAGHQVFFDTSNLPPGSDFNTQIRNAVAVADRMVFLVNRRALSPGKYTRTELEYAQQRWPSPVGKLYPVLVDPELESYELPSYLRSVHCLRVSGNAPAEVLDLIEQTSSVKMWCWTCLAVSVLTAATAAGALSYSLRQPAGFAEVTLLAPEYAHFRPRSRPPDDPAANASVDWVSSPVTLTVPVAYSYTNSRTAIVQLHREQANLQLGSLHGDFLWTYVVDIGGSQVSDASCNGDWLCRKSNVSTQNLRPGETTSTRETMFLANADQISWGQFIDSIVSPDGPSIATLSIRATVVTADGNAGANTVITAHCQIDVAGSRRRMLDAGFRPGHDPRPTTWQPRCMSAP